MFKIKIFSIHKTKKKWLNDAIKEYEKRLLNKVSFEFIICKNDLDLEKKVFKENSYICLDENGQKIPSIKFNKKIFNFFETFGPKLSFVIGGENGLSETLKNKAFFVFSLSELTFTHHITRLILIEQIYRSFEIQKNSKYHK